MLLGGAEDEWCDAASPYRPLSRHPDENLGLAASHQYLLSPVQRVTSEAAMER
jgi:hypothetical protein